MVVFLLSMYLFNAAISFSTAISGITFMVFVVNSERNRGKG